jgi:hypothetical protein
MVLLEINKPDRKSMAHYKALVYVDLLSKGFDVYLDVTSNALFQYTSGLKGYQKTKFDIIIFIEDKPRLVVNFSKSNRRNTKMGLFGIPILTVDVNKWEKSKVVKDAIKILTQFP